MRTAGPAPVPKMYLSRKSAPKLSAYFPERHGWDLITCQACDLELLKVSVQKAKAPRARNDTPNLLA